MASKSSSQPKVRVLLVCLGNICRSPSAHGVLEKYIKDKGLEEQIEVDSAGTGDWHIGKPPDPRSITAARKRGYDLSQLVARQVRARDFQDFDYILAMDRSNLRALQELSPPSHRARLRLFLDYGSSAHDTVPDPYYSGEQGFELVLDLIEDACERLLTEIATEHLDSSASAS